MNEVLIKSIINKGGLALLSLGDKFGSIPLHSAVQYSQITSIELLLNLGSPINVTATESFHLLGFQYLLHAGATPLDTAVKTHQVAIIKLLLKYGGLLNLPVLVSDKPFLVQAQEELATEKASIVLAIDRATDNNISPIILIELITDYAS